MLDSKPQPPPSHRANPPRSLLVVAHPGHELRLYGWMTQNRPDVIVLTDGGGSIGQPRVASSRRLLDAVGATACSPFGAHSDQQFYAALLNADHGFFAHLETALADTLRGGYDVVVADPFEGYNPTHDLCRLLVNVALERLRCEGRPRAANYEYALTAPLPTPTPPGDDLADVVVKLDGSALTAKIAAARGYPELQWEVDRALEREGMDAFAHEVLRPLCTTQLQLSPPTLPPHYEIYGEKKRADGVYAEVIRYEQHFVPVARQLVAALPPIKPEPRRS